MTKPRKQVLFIAATHGNEPIGVAAAAQLGRRSRFAKLFDVEIGNPRALARGIRFVDADLNRVAPGNSKSRAYEVRRANELTAKFKNYRFIVDLHQTRANDRIVIILPRLTRNALRLALMTPVRDVLIWPSASLQSSGSPLVQCAESGIEIESGTKTNVRKTLLRLTTILVRFLRRVQSDALPPLTRSALERRRFYLVYSRIDPEEVGGKKLRDFVPTVSRTGEAFIPLLFGKHQGLLGYKMRRVDMQWVKEHTAH